MARNSVHNGQRLRVLFDEAHTSGDFVYCKGFYGWVEESVASGSWGYLIRDRRAILAARVPSTVAMGTLLAAPATAIATTLPLLAYAGNGTSLGIPATAGWYPVGRTIATGNATVAKMVMFADQIY